VVVVMMMMVVMVSHTDVDSCRGGGRQCAKGKNGG
jgi:hypothetical protein